jgi:superfamily II DNA helicase RecQ
MHSYADRYTHDFFFERDYPDVLVLDQIFAKLSRTAVERTALQKQSRIPMDVFEKALEKLWAHGGAVVDSSDNVSLGTAQWRDAYIAQGEQKRTQIEQVIRYAQSSQCRMASLIRHFGDIADGQKPCGVCDFCAPVDCIAQRYRPPSEAERLTASDILDELGVAGGRSLGKLHTDLCTKNGMSRDAFEEVVGALARAGLIRLTEAIFEKDGKQIPYRKATLTREADFVDREAPLEMTIRDTGGPVAEVGGKRRRKKAETGKKTRLPLARPKSIGTRAAGAAAEKPAPRESPAEDLLRAWRLAQAKRQAIPAFRIMSDKVLTAIASKRPRTAAELLAIPGIGVGAVEKYGAQIYKILNQAERPRA